MAKRQTAKTLRPMTGREKATFNAAATLATLGVEGIARIPNTQLRVTARVLAAELDSLRTRAAEDGDLNPGSIRAIVDDVVREVSRAARKLRDDSRSTEFWVNLSPSSCDLPEAARIVSALIQAIRDLRD